MSGVRSTKTPDGVNIIILIYFDKLVTLLANPQIVAVPVCNLILLEKFFGGKWGDIWGLWISTQLHCDNVSKKYLFRIPHIYQQHYQFCSDKCNPCFDCYQPCIDV